MPTMVDPRVHTNSTFVRGSNPFRDDASGASKPFSTRPPSHAARTSRSARTNAGMTGNSSLESYIAKCEKKISELRGKRRNGDMIQDEAGFLELKKTGLLVEHFKHLL